MVDNFHPFGLFDSQNDMVYQSVGNEEYPVDDALVGVFLNGEDEDLPPSLCQINSIPVFLQQEFPVRDVDVHHASSSLMGSLHDPESTVWAHARDEDPVHHASLSFMDSFQDPAPSVWSRARDESPMTEKLCPPNKKAPGRKMRTSPPTTQQPKKRKHEMRKKDEPLTAEQQHAVLTLFKSCASEGRGMDYLDVRKVQYLMQAVQEGYFGSTSPPKSTTNADMIELRSQYTQQRERMQLLQRKLEECEKQNKQLQSRVDHSESEIPMHAATMAQKKREYECMMQQKELKNKQEKLELTSSITVLEQRLVMAKKDTVSAETQLKTQREEYERRLAEQRADFAKTSEEYESKLAKQREDVAKQYEEYESRLAAQRAEFDKKREEYERRLDAQCAEYDKTRADYERRLTEQRADFDKKHEECERKLREHDVAPIFEQEVVGLPTYHYENTTLTLDVKCITDFAFLPDLDTSNITFNAVVDEIGEGHFGTQFVNSAMSLAEKLQRIYCVVPSADQPQSVGLSCVFCLSTLLQSDSAKYLEHMRVSLSNTGLNDKQAQDIAKEVETLSRKHKRPL